MHDELHRSSPQGLTNVNKIHSFTVDFAVLGSPNMADVPIGTGEIHHNNKKQQTNLKKQKKNKKQLWVTEPL